MASMKRLFGTLVLAGASLVTSSVAAQDIQIRGPLAGAVYAAAVIPFTVWMLRGFVAGVPVELRPGDDDLVLVRAGGLHLAAGRGALSTCHGCAS